MDAGRVGVAEAQECLGEMLMEFGVVESEASRFVTARGVHVVLREGGGPPGVVAVAEGGERAEFAPCGDLGAVQAVSAYSPAWWARSSASAGRSPKNATIDCAPKLHPANR